MSVKYFNDTEEAGNLVSRTIEHAAAVAKLPLVTMVLRRWPF